MEQHGAAPPRPAKPGRVEPAERGARPQRPARPAQAPLVTLDTPRPDNERTLNTYVEAPPRPHLLHHQHHQQLQLQQHHRPPQLPPLHSQQNNADKHQLLQGPRQQPPSLAPVTSQPSAKRSTTCPRPLDSIRCPQCGCCRCDQCAHPRPLPSKWLGKSCLCSAETAIDYTSCMCCVKALFYHCCNESGEEEEEGAACADEPCSCTGSRRAERWCCLIALTFALPCMLCYWPLRGAAALCAGAYARVAHPGCRCAPHRAAPPVHPPY